MRERCRRCGFLACQHDPIDLRCPEDEEEAAHNQAENE